MDAIGDLLKNMQISGGINDESYSKMSTNAWIWGIICLAVFVFVAIALKSNKTFGIIAGVINAIYIILSPTMIKAFHGLEFFKTIYGPADQLDDLAAQFYAEQTPKMIAYFGGSILMLAGFVFALIFIIKSMKSKPKVFPILALVVEIFGYLFIGPLNYMTMFTGGATIEGQISQANTHYAFLLIPVLLLVVPAIMNLVKKPTPAAEEAPAAEEVPTDENTQA